jgi:hypothetical protein
MARCQRKALAGCVPGLNRKGRMRWPEMMEVELRVHGGPRVRRREGGIACAGWKRTWRSSLGSG